MKNILLLPPFLFFACTLDTNLLSGHWKAVAFYENGLSHPAPLDSVALVFSENGRYEFRSVGFYRETGPFRISGHYLFLTDTTEQPAKEHALQVLFLSADTLKIQMQKDRKEQVLFLTKTR